MIFAKGKALLSENVMDFVHYLEEIRLRRKVS